MDYFGTDKGDVISQSKLKLQAGVNIYALNGNDVIELAGGNVEGGAGNDTLIGTVLWDTAIYRNSPKGVVIDLETNTVQDGYGTVDTIRNINWFQGSNNNDVFIGNAANNSFWSFSKHDLVSGGAGVDKVIISIFDVAVQPQFKKTGSGWTISYQDTGHGTQIIDTTSVEVLTVYRGSDVWDFWDLIAPTPRLVPDPAFAFQPVPYLDANRDQWHVRSWGIESLTFTENAGAWYYPTPSDYREPANIGANMSNVAVGDFNGDGFQDMLLTWAISPHIIPHETQPIPTLLLGSASGLVKAQDGIFPESVARPMAYRSFAANLNGDGVDDIVSGAMHAPAWVDDAHTILDWRAGPTLAVLGASSGQLKDVSNLLGSQTLTQGEVGSSFDHATAVGDLNRDGRDDIFSGNNLWISSPDGRWQDATIRVQELLPKNMSPMSLAIGDLNNDSANDILVLYPDFQSDRIILFNDASSSLNFTRIMLPPGLYGNNTKDNFAMIADVNFDGLNDIVIAETRAQPYYIGSAMQILIQKSPGVFADETISRIDNSQRDTFAGEGQLFWLDVNGDGYKDIVHSNDGDGVAIFLNDGAGHFSLYDTAQLNPIRTFQLDGFQNGLTDEVALPSFRANPIDDNHDGIMDWVVQAIRPHLTNDPNEDQEVVIYLLDSTGKEFGRDKAEVLKGTIYSDQIYGLGGNDQMTGFAGNDTLDGGAGMDIANWAAKSANYELHKTKDGWQLRDLNGNDGTDTLINIEKLQFTDRSVIIESQSHGSYSDIPTELYQFFITAFNAAPGVTYMDQLAEAYRYGLSVKKIVDIFTTKSQFTDVYSPTLSHTDMATQLVNNIVKNSTTTAAKAEAISDIKGALDIGWTVGDVIYTVFGNLADKSLTDISWGNTAKQFNNEIAVAKYYTETLNQSTTDLETLRDVIQPVTQSTNVSSDAVVAQLIGVALMTGGVGS